jgi:hypothetical protein
MEKRGTGTKPAVHQRKPKMPRGSGGLWTTTFRAELLVRAQDDAFFGHYLADLHGSRARPSTDLACGPMLLLEGSAREREARLAGG